MRGLRVNVVGVVAVAALLTGIGVAPDSPVADAAMRRDVESVRSLVRQGADVNAAQADGMTALHWAAAHGDAELANLLIQAGANLEAVTRLGSHTPLHVATRGTDVAVIRALLDAGANPNATTTTGVTPLHHAARAGSAEAVSALLERGASVDARESAWEQTPLMFAAAFNHADVIKVLLARGADPGVYSKMVDIERLTAVDGVARRVREQVLSTFRPQGDDAKSWRPAPREVQAAVRAAREIQRSMTEAPAATGDQDDSAGGGEGGGPSATTQGGLTPLLHAVREGHHEAALALLAEGADVNQVKRGDGTSPLLMAAINGEYDLALRLLERGADPNLAATTDGVTPLFAVLSNYWGPKTRYPQPQAQNYQQASYLETMEALLEAGAEPNARLTGTPWYLMYTFGSLGVDFTGATAFFRAAHATDVDAMRLLVAYGADYTLPTLATTSGGRGGGRGGYGGGAGGAGGSDPSGLPPVRAGGPGVYPIHAAAGVSYGQSYTANFHRHAPDAWMASVKYLVEELGADVNVRDLNGYNAVHHAASRGDNEMILYLVSKGADVMAVSRRGQTTVDMANGPGQRISPHPATIALLEGLGAKNNHRCVSC
ncbi:MAG: ankyrin repeat domain-containing protein [Gemmatimonadetes bacterium]|nr:ankyrin repeat domain-containing protein [Gemmatimonadota bacterium]